MRAGRAFRKVNTPKKTVLSLSLGEGGCSSSETKHDRRKAPRAKLGVSDRRLQKQRSQRDKLTWVQFAMKMVSVDQKLSMTENSAKTKVVCFGKGITGANTAIL
jgi:hypothetical protein